MLTAQSPKKGPGSLRRYGLAILAAGFALWSRTLLFPLLGNSNPYHTVWLAVVFSAWYCGLGPSIVTTVISVAGVWYWILPHHHSVHPTEHEAAGLIGFLVFSGVIVAFGEANRCSLAKSQWAEEELRKAHAELEQKVQERTADLNQANESLRQLSGRLQQMQDEERRQIARELHDSVGQLLAALGMNMGVLQRQADKVDAAGSRAISENAALVEQISREIRTISHLLHPPLLDVAGLASALRWYVDGFSERSQIKVAVQIPEDLARMSPDTELAIFRMVQECLTNIHRHSGGDAATIRLQQQDGQLQVEVQDSGKGISPEKQQELHLSGQTGVGFRGMRERLRQLGGTLDIRSSDTGTTVIAMLPMQDPNTERAGSEVDS
jgi:signal transduction histidine kinase